MAKKYLDKGKIEDIWPMAKKEIEKGLENAKKMLAAGEKYLKDLSEKGIEKTKKTSFALKREKLYYDLGKTVASTSPEKYTSNKKISKLAKEIKKLDKEIKKIK